MNIARLYRSVVPLTLVVVFTMCSAQAFAATPQDTRMGAFPYVDWYGTDTLPYRGLDGSTRSDSAAITLSAAPDNEPPRAFADTYSVDQFAKLTAADSATGDNFGNSIAMFGDTAVVGAPYDDLSRGSAYVYVRTGTVWTQQAKLTADDGTAIDLFGYSVAISGDTIVVGAYLGPGRLSNSGAAYVYVRSGTTWTLQAKLVAADGESEDSFGYSVALSGDTALVGAFGDDDERAYSSGSAYVFVRSGATWSQQTKLTAADGTVTDYSGDRFGEAVALSGDTALIGARFAGFGAAYIYVRAGTTWTEQAKLVAEDGEWGDQLGISVALSDDTALIGAWTDDPKGTGSGSAYVFVRSGTTWTQQAKLTAADGAAEDWFGHAVALSGDTAAVGAYAGDGKAVDSGATYVFVRADTYWTQQVKLTAADGAAGDRFGCAVAISGDTVLAGARYDNDNGQQSGAAFAFEVLGEDGSLVRNAPGVLGNDTDAEGDALSANLVTGVSHGALALSPDGAFTYTPAPGWYGIDSFSYRAFDGKSFSDTVTVSVNTVFAVDTFTVSALPRVNGTITPSSQSVDFDADSTTITITPDAGYHFVSVSDESGLITTVEGTVTGSRQFRVSGVRTDHTISAVFARTERPVTRAYGSDRYGTAAAMARKGWDPTGKMAWTGVKHVIIANGEPGKEPDPLSAAGLAGVYDAPVLAVQAGKVPGATKTVITEIARKNPGVRIHIVGGTAVVPDARWNDIRRITGVSQVKDRFAGRDRYETSALMATRIVSVKGAAGVTGVVLIAGDNPAAFYDALAASPAAYARTMPMLSVRKTSIPISVGNVLKSAALKGKPRYAASSATYLGSVPAAGATRMTTSAIRYAAAAQIAKFVAVDRTWTSRSDTAIASKLPDALTGGAFLGRRGGIMLFTDASGTIQSTSKTFITTHGTRIDQGWVIGGTAVVPTAQETSFRSLLN